MKSSEKILLAGATGYLGQFILAELLKKRIPYPHYSAQ